MEALIIAAVLILALLSVFGIIRANLKICQPKEVLIFSGRCRRLSEGGSIGYRVIQILAIVLAVGAGSASAQDPVEIPTSTSIYTVEASYSAGGNDFVRVKVVIEFAHVPGATFFSARGWGPQEGERRWSLTPVHTSVPAEPFFPKAITAQPGNLLYILASRVAFENDEDDINEMYADIEADFQVSSYPWQVYGQMPEVFRSWVSFERDTVSVGETFEAKLNFDNYVTPGPAIEDVVPKGLLTTTSDDDGSVTVESGPTPESVGTLTYSTSSSMTYTLTAESAGTVRVEGILEAAWDHFYPDVIESVSVCGKFESTPCTVVIEESGFMVNSTGDDPLDDGLDPEEDGCSTGGSIMRDGEPETECTLRAALAIANAQAQQGEAVTILFDIPGTGPHGIAVGEPLVLDNQDGGQITIDALGEGGTAFVPELPIFLYGTGPSVGLDVYGTALIRGFAIADFTYGIRLQSGSTVEKVHLVNNNTGILIEQEGNAVQGSIISGNTVSGVTLAGAAAQQNKIYENYIGTNYDATEAWGNGGGVLLTEGASSNEVSSNVVSGNTGWGISAYQGAQGNYIASNYIGLDLTAEKALPNRDGVGLVGASNNTLANNYIAGNTVSEVTVRGGEEGVAEGNLIQGNFIGVNYTITKAVGLGFVFLENADNNMVGGATPDLGNYVQAVRIDGGTNNDVLYNYIGLQPNREPLAGAENSIRYGIRLANEAHQNVIQANTVAFRSQQGIVIDSGADANRVEYNEVFLNGGAGIGVLPDAAATNALRANAIFDNWGLGIDLGNDGVNYYNAPAGEAWTPAPYIEAVYTSDAKDTADIWMYVPASDGTYIVDFYAVRQSSADPVRVGCDTSGFGEGEQWIGSNSNIAGGVTLAGTHAIPPGYTHIAATATREDGGTSEFSWCHAIAEAENAAAVPFDCSQNGLVVNERGVRLLVTDTDGTSGAGENRLYVARFEEEPANNLFAGTATTNDGTLGTPDRVQSRYYSMEATGALANPTGGEGNTCQVTYDLCLDATNQTTENNFDRLLLLQRNRRTSYVWTPHDTRIEQEGDTRYACASSLTDFGEFSFGLINATEIAAPQLLSPENDATDVLLGSALSWEAMPDANSYDVQVALDAGFTVLLTDTTDLASTTVIPDSLARDRLHYWRVRGVMASGEAGPRGVMASGEAGPWSVPLRFSTGATGVAVEEEAEMPKAFVLEANYPNPFNPQTTIGFALPQASAVRLVVYDILGREVARLVEGTLAAGRHEVVFDASGLPTGVYLYRLQADGFIQVRRMLLVK